MFGPAANGRVPHDVFTFVKNTLHRAMVVESRDVWFEGDGALTKELCEELQENDDEQPEINEPCCACDEAKYEVSVGRKVPHGSRMWGAIWVGHLIAPRFIDYLAASQLLLFRAYQLLLAGC